MIFIDDNKVNIRRFPDGTFSQRIPLTIEKIEWRYETDREIIDIFYIVKHLNSKGVLPEIYIPYLPNARMDRTKEDDEVFTLDYFSELLNTLKFSCVYVLDPHSKVCLEKINGIKALSPEIFIKNTVSMIDDPNLVVYHPDKGSVDRYSKMLNSPYAYGNKKREGDTINLELLNRDLVKDKNVLLIDDICSAGGSFTKSMAELKKAGAKDFYLYVTHCERTIFKGESIKMASKIFTTNSIFREEFKEIYLRGDRGIKEPEITVFNVKDCYSEV